MSDDVLRATGKATEQLSKVLQRVLEGLGPIQIGKQNQFPFGWRRAGKGRTVWRLIEEAIVQGLEVRRAELGLVSVIPAPSETGVYDVEVTLADPAISCYINIKAAAEGRRAQKDDVSKAVNLVAFFSSNSPKELFLATVYMDFITEHGALLVALRRCAVMPVSWIPDIYVNPSNNGNLQSSKYRNPESAIKRTQDEFLIELKRAMETAAASRRRKMGS
jgi:hypothetical protein